MKLKVKNKPQFTLSQLLRRRKVTLSKFMSEQGISTYDALIRRCESIGVTPPSEQEYVAVDVQLVSNPQEGLVVLDPIPIVDETTGHEIDRPSARPTMNEIQDFATPERKRKKSISPKVSKDV